MPQPKTVVLVWLNITLITFSGLSQTVDEGLTDLSNQITSGMSEGKKQKIAVVEFSDLEGRVTEFGKFLSEELITRLFISKKFNVVERQLLNKVLEEHKLNVTGLVDESTAKQLGKILGVDAICSGTVTEFADHVRINARLISTESGEIFSVAATKIAKDESIKTLMKKYTSIKSSSSQKEGFGLKAEYFNMPAYDNAPPGIFEDPILTREDENIDFSWGTGSPGKNVTSDYFGVRWAGQIFAPVSGTYFFKLCIDEYDLTRLLINNKIAIEHWNLDRFHKALRYGETGGCPSGQIFLKGDQWHEFRVDYYEDNGPAGIHLYWIASGEKQYGLIPSNYLKSE